MPQTPQDTGKLARRSWLPPPALNAHSPHLYLDTAELLDGQLRSTLQRRQLAHRNAGPDERPGGTWARQSR